MKKSISVNLNPATIEQITDRVLTSRSGIAVFKEKGNLKSCFANTVDCAIAIKNKDINYLFTLDKSMSVDSITRKLTAAS